MKRSSARKIATLLISGVVFIVCLRYVVVSFRWVEIFPIIKNADLRWLVGVEAVSIILYWLLRTLRWFILLRNMNVHISFVDLYICSAVSLSFSNYTPFQSGEMLKIELLRKYSGLERFPGYSSFVVERAVDLFVVVSIAVISILISFDFGISRSNVVLIWAVLVFFLLLGFSVVSKIKISGRVGEFLHDTMLCVSNSGTLLAVVLLTFCSWTMVSIAWQICLYSISIGIGFQKTLALTSIVTLINILSLIPAAIGVSEASSAEFLIRLGHSTASAQAGALVLRVHALVAVFLGVTHFAFWRMLRNRRCNVLRSESG